MSVSSVGTGTVGAGQFQQRSQGPGGYFRQLIQAIKSGNLDAAQSAYDGLTSQLPASDQPSTTTSTSDSDGGKSSFQQFLQQVGAALQSGDIQSAQDALNSFEQTAKVGDGHHHHHGGGGVEASTATSADTGSSSGTGASTSVNLTV